MKFPKHSLARRETSERIEGAATAMPRQTSDPAVIGRVVELLVSARENVLVSGAEGPQFDRWARSAAAALRSRHDVELEIYMPSTADALVQRFNSVARTLSLEDARADALGASPLRVLLIADARALLLPEGLLLARLVSDFPAIGLRLLILSDDTAAVDTHRTLREIFAKRIHHLTIESSAAEWFSDPQPDTRVQPERLALGPVAGEPAVKSTDVATTGGRLINDDHRIEPLFSVPASRSRFQRTVVWLAAVVALVLVSALVLVLVHRDRTPAGAFKGSGKAGASVSTHVLSGSSAGGRQ